MENWQCNIDDINDIDDRDGRRVGNGNGNNNGNGDSNGNSNGQHNNDSDGRCNSNAVAMITMDSTMVMQWQ